MNSIIYFYLTIIFLLLILNPINLTSQWKYKYMLIYLGTFFLSISLFIDNIIINKYVLQFILFLNILILIPLTIIKKPSILNMLSVLAVIVILLTFNYKELEVEKGVIINLNEKWLLTYVLGLSLYFMLSNYKLWNFNRKIFNIVLLVYPLIFTAKEYFIHRGFSLTIVCLISNLQNKFSKIS